MSILNSISEQVNCKMCNYNSMEMVVLTCLRKGLASRLELSCKNCKYVCTFRSSKQITVNGDGVSRPNSINEVNIRLSYGLRRIGKGQMAAEAFCAVMDLP